MSVRVSNSVPDTEKEIFTEGALLGISEGLVGAGAVITIGGETEYLVGSQIIIQHNVNSVLTWDGSQWENFNKDPRYAGQMDLAEIKVFGW